MEENDRKDNNKDPFADGSPSEEDVKRERGPRISYIVAGICALLVTAAAGAAIVADKAFRKEESARIYSSSSAVGAKDSSVSEDSSDASAASKGKSDSSASESRSESKSEKKKTATTTTAVVYEYPQDINKAELECFLAVSGINKTVAEGIVSYRERKGAIHNFEELLEIYGIGERTLTVIEEHFFISSDDSIAYTTASQTTRKPAETEKKTSAPEKTTTVPTVTEPPKVTSAESEAEPADSSEAEAVMKDVNINKADAEEIAECLLLKPEQAEEIVKLREQIGQFSDLREILYTGVVSKSELNERKEHILLE